MARSGGTDNPCLKDFGTAMQRHTTSWLRTSGRIAYGSLLAIVTAGLIARAFAGSAHRLFIPVWFVAVVFVLALRYGPAVGVVGSLAAAWIFAHALFSPLGNWHVADNAARQSLAWMVLGGISLSYFFAPSRGKRTGNSADATPATPYRSRSGGQNRTFNSREK